MMDPNFFKTELYERERRQDEIRQARQARLARLARSDAAFNHSDVPGWLQLGFGRALAGLGTRLYQLGSHMAGSNLSNQPPDPCLELTSSSSPGVY
jgi:hypothetical protein